MSWESSNDHGTPQSKEGLVSDVRATKASSVKNTSVLDPGGSQNKSSSQCLLYITVYIVHAVGLENASQNVTHELQSLENLIKCILPLLQKKSYCWLSEQSHGIKLTKHCMFLLHRETSSLGLQCTVQKDNTSISTIQIKLSWKHWKDFKLERKMDRETFAYISTFPFCNS